MLLLVLLLPVAVPRPAAVLQAAPCCMLLCNKIAEAEAAVSVNEKKWLVLHAAVSMQVV
jgi:hypothetical protein